MDGCLYHEKPGKWCLVVPEKMRPRILHDADGGRFTDHFGDKRVYDLWRRYYWWAGMWADVHHHCHACLVCASQKGTGCASRPSLQQITVGSPFHRVGMDILKLPTSFKGICMQWCSHKIGPASDQTAQTVARLFVEGVVCRHGAPQ